MRLILPACCGLKLGRNLISQLETKFGAEPSHLSLMIGLSSRSTRSRYPRLRSLPSAAPKITLALAIFKFDRMEWAIEKCTEIGVARIIPVIARRTDAHLAAAAVKRHERWQRIVRQAAEQSRRSAPPEVEGPVKLKELDRVLPDALTRVVLAESEDDARLGDVLQSKPNEVALAIGPEGGWASGELSWFFETGWVAASLGDTILRAETAAIVATALALEEYA